MKLFRKIVFYIFFAIYLVLCPLVIFYAFGYIFTPKVEEGFVKTGLIRFETLPSNASISIADKRFIQKTPTTIRSLLAGRYDVRISLPGYRPWTRKIEVEPGKAVNFSNVLLVPQKLKTRPLIARHFEDLYPVLGTRFLLLKSSDRAGDLRVFDWKDEVSRPVLPRMSLFTTAKLVKIFMAHESSFVLLEVEGPGGRKFLGCQLDKNKPEIKDLSGLFPKGEPAEVLWEGDSPDYLFALYGQNLSRIDLEKMTVLSGFLQRIRGFGLFKGKVYALKSSSIVRLNFNARQGDESLVEKGVFLENLFRDDGKFKIDFISNNTICLSSEKGEFFSNVLPYRFINEGMKDYRADPDGRKVVLWQEQRIGVLDLEKPERKKELFERGPEIEWFFEKGNNIRNAYFVYDSAYVLFCDDEEVFLVRIRERGGPVEKLTKVRKDSAVFYSEKTGILYYLEPSRGYLTAAEILPEGSTFSRVINELEKETQGVAQ